MTERNDEEDLRVLVQQAIDATSTAYTEDASLDVRQALHAALRERGVDIDDAAWLDEAAQNIRSGHPVVVGTGAPQDESRPPPEPR